MQLLHLKNSKDCKDSRGIGSEHSATMLIQPIYISSSMAAGYESCNVKLLQAMPYSTSHAIKKAMAVKWTEKNLDQGEPRQGDAEVDALRVQIQRACPPNRILYNTSSTWVRRI